MLKKACVYLILFSYSPKQEGHDHFSLLVARCQNVARSILLTVQITTLSFPFQFLRSTLTFVVVAYVLGLSALLGHSP